MGAPRASHIHILQIKAFTRRSGSFKYACFTTCIAFFSASQILGPFGCQNLTFLPDALAVSFLQHWERRIYLVFQFGQRLQTNPNLRSLFTGCIVDPEAYDSICSYFRKSRNSEQAFRGHTIGVVHACHGNQRFPHPSLLLGC